MCQVVHEWQRITQKQKLHGNFQFHLHVILKQVPTVFSTKMICILVTAIQHFSIFQFNNFTSNKARVQTDLSRMSKPVLHSIPADRTMLFGSRDCTAQLIRNCVGFIPWNIFLVVKHFRSIKNINELFLRPLSVILIGYALR